MRRFWHGLSAQHCANSPAAMHASTGPQSTGSEKDQTQKARNTAVAPSIWAPEALVYLHISAMIITFCTVKFTFSPYLEGRRR